MNGFAFEPETCGSDVVKIRPCNVESKPNGETPDEENYDPFYVVAVDQCSRFSVKTWDDHTSRARRKLEACLPARLEKELWTGEEEGDNNFLAKSGEVEDISPAGAGLSPINALAILEKELAECACGGRGTIHMTRKMATLLCSVSAVRNENGRLFTCMDTVVVAGAGYTGSAPGAATPFNPPVGEEYMYGTGPIAVLLANKVDIYPSRLEEAVDRSNNTVRVYAERGAAAFYDSCCQLGIRADVPGPGGS